MKRLSVIICTYNPREDYLRRTLAALKAQSLPLVNWELLLIDNASTSPLARRVDLGWHPNARHLREDKPGKLNAWLLGIKEFKGDMLIFVDDDNVLAPDYLEKTLEIGEAWPFVGVWGGSLVPEFEAPLPSWCGTQAWRLTIINVPEDIWSNLKNDFTTMPVGAGMCVRRKVAERYLEWCALNPQRASLDRSGTGLGGYGDIDLCHCALDLGLGTGKSKHLSLTHLISASRLTLDYFVRHAEGDAISLTMFRAGRGFPIPEPKPLTLVGKLRWFVHRLKKRVPREQYEIQKAHQRGMERGYKQAREFLDSKKSARP
jgi:glycosyltransferase involved in cell wall biosynthesis